MSSFRTARSIGVEKPSYLSSAFPKDAQKQIVHKDDEMLSTDTLESFDSRKKVQYITKGSEKTTEKNASNPLGFSTIPAPVVSQKQLPEQKRKSSRGISVADLIKTPLPIFVMGMPKAGTSSLANFFQCGLGRRWRHRVSHYECGKGYVFNASLAQQSSLVPCGIRLVRNVDAKKPLLDRIDHFDVYTELDANVGHDRLYLPQISYTRAIYNGYPNATWILNIRDPHKWLSSVNRWRDLRDRFTNSTFKIEWFQKGVGQKDSDMLRLYNHTLAHIRNFVTQNPSITLVEVMVEEPNAGQVLEDAFGISRQCWGQHNVQKPG